MKLFPKNLITLCFLALFLSLQASPANSAFATDVTASDGLWAGRVEVTWTSAYAAGFHNVIRRVDGTNTYTQIEQITIDGTTTQYSFDDLTAVLGTTYHYSIKSCYDITCETSFEDPGWRGDLDTVEKIQASDGSFADYTYVTWMAVPDAEYYEVFRSLSLEGVKTHIGTETKLAFRDISALPNTKFLYWVRACYGLARDKLCSEFYFSDQGSRTWPTVENIVATDGDHVGFVRVTWDAVSGATGYRVHYSENGGTDYLGYETVTGAESYDYVLPVVTFAYTFGVVPCFDTQCDNLIRSNPDDGWPALPAPVNLQASEGNSSTLVTWDEVDPTTQYHLFRDSVNSPSGTSLAGNAGFNENFQDDFADGALPGVLYNYWVIGCMVGAPVGPGPGCSDYSEPDSGYYLPARPSNLAASDGTIQDHILVSWEAIEGASSYAIERTEVHPVQNPALVEHFVAKSNSLKDSSAAQGEEYWYVARACGIDYCGAPSGTDSGYKQSTCFALTRSTVGNGTLSASPKNSLGCPGGQYVRGEKIELSAIPDSEWTIESWTNTDDDSSTLKTNYVTMPASALEVTAKFNMCNHLALQSINGGTLTADPVSSDQCFEGQYFEGEVITLTATPDDDTWALDTWTGTDDDSSTETTNQYTMKLSQHTVTATFSRKCQVLSLNTIGDGELYPTPDQSTHCPAGSFVDGEVIALKAAPDLGWQLDGWAGTDNDAITETDNQYTMTTSDHAVTATFSRQCYKLDIRTNGGGVVKTSPLSSKDCPVDTYFAGEVITLTAVPDTGWHVLSWWNTDDDTSTALTNTHTMDAIAQKGVTVNFYSDSQLIFSDGFEGKGQ